MRRRRVEFLPTANRDLASIARFLVSIGASVRTSERYVRSLRARCAKIGDLPYVGTAHDELLPGLRTLGYKRSARITFRVLPDRVQIVNVFYGGRDIDGFYHRQRGEND